VTADDDFRESGSGSSTGSLVTANSCGTFDTVPLGDFSDRTEGLYQWNFSPDSMGGRTG
jgi:hypothetical protein